MREQEGAIRSFAGCTLVARSERASAVSRERRHWLQRVHCGLTSASILRLHVAMLAVAQIAIPWPIPQPAPCPG